MTRVLALSLYGPKAASHRVRLAQYKPYLAELGIHLDIQSLLCDSYIHRRFNGDSPLPTYLISSYLKRIYALLNARQYDALIVYAELFTLLPYCFESLFLNVPYILDFDDAFYLRYKTGRLRFLSPFLGGKFDQLLRGASAVSAGNPHLADYALLHNPKTFIIPSVVDTNHYRPSSTRSPIPCFTVGWIGSPSTSPYLHSLVQPLSSFARERPVRLHVVGASAPSIPGVQVIESQWSLDTEVQLLNQFSVGVMPLPDTPWTRGKCAYKLIQCMACSKPVIASPVGVNVHLVTPSTGFLARTHDEWLSSFRLLADDPTLCSRLGLSGRDLVHRNFSLRSALPLLVQLIRNVAVNN